MSRVSRRTFLAAGASLLTASGATGKGARFPSERVVFQDPLTGRPVSRLTDPAILHHLPHFHHRFISHKDDFLLFASERTGSRQIFQMLLPEGELIQQTDGPGVHSYSPTLAPKERTFFVLQDDLLKEVWLRGSRQQKIFRCPGGWNFTGHLSVSEDGRYAAVIEMKSGHEVEGFQQQFERRPRCRLRVIEIKSGRGNVVVEEDHWLAHPQFRLGGTDILYAHEGPWHQVQGRLRLVTIDGREKRTLRGRQGSEGFGNEFWAARGRGIFYVHYPDESGRHATVRRLDMKDLQERIVSPCTSFGWMQGNADNSVIVGGSRRASGPNIYLLFVRIKREITICEHFSSGKSYPILGTRQQDPDASCPFPVFSDDSQWIYFTSDKEGLPAIYRAQVTDLVEET